MNSVSLTGRLTNDPVRRDTTRGVVASFRIAVDDRPERLWIDVEAWGHVAGVAAKHLRQRRHVAVTGRLRSSSYHDSHGQRQHRFYVIADRITFLDAPDDAPRESDATTVSQPRHCDPATTAV